MPDCLIVALEYHAAGLAVLPLPFGSKEPALSWGAWADAPQSKADIRALFRKADESNILGLGGSPSQNLVILDADCMPVRAEVESRFGTDGISTWSITSNTTGDHRGGGTWFVRTPVPVRSVTITLTSGKLEVRSTGAYTILPPSKHPTGTVYTTVVGSPARIFTLPTLTALDWLELEPADSEPKKQKKIPRLAWRLLQSEAAAVGKYQSRSEAESALVCSLIRAGYSFDEIAHLMIVYPGPGKFAEKYQVKPKTAMDYLRLTFRNAQEYITGNASEAEQRARDLRAWALSRPWPGQTGATDRAVYLAHLAIVEKCGQSPHGASARELAEIAGVSWQTAARANHRLVAAGLLSLDTLATASLSARYSLSWTRYDTQSTHTVMECRILSQSSDTFRTAGLGKTGAEVWAQLAESGEKGIAEKNITNVTGRSLRTVKRKLGKMLALGMVEPMGDGQWRAVQAVDLDAIAHELGTFGAGDAQRAKHATDRRQHRSVLELGRKWGIV